MNKVDLIILLVILLFMLVGYRRGLIKTIFSVIGYFIITYFSILLAPVLSKILIINFEIDKTLLNFVTNNEKFFSIISDEILQNIVGRIVNVIAFVILFIVLKLIFHLIVSVLNNIANLPILSTVNKLGGLLLGTLEGIVIIYLIILMVNWIPTEYCNNLSILVDNSFLGSSINYYVPEVAIEVISMIKLPK